MELNSFAKKSAKVFDKIHELIRKIRKKSENNCLSSILVSREISRQQLTFLPLIDNNDLFTFIFNLIKFAIAHAECLV